MLVVALFVLNSLNSTNSNCGQANGSMTCTVGGGTSPYNYLWCNGVTTISNNNVLAGRKNIFHFQSQSLFYYLIKCLG